MNIVGLEISPNTRPIASARGYVTKRGCYFSVPAPSSPPPTPPAFSSNAPTSPQLASPSLPLHPPTPALIKFFANAHPSDEQVLRMRYEYMAFQRKTVRGYLAIRGLGSTHPLSLYRDPVIGLALVYSDIGGCTLDNLQYDCEVPDFRLLSHKSLVSLEEMIECGLTVADHLGALHQDGIIYKSLSPQTTLYNKSTRACLFLDYCQSSMLERELIDLHTTITSMNKKGWDIDSIGENLWPYMSPEQTGRMIRHVDARSDLYSLGCLFYEIMTDAALDMIHNHLAKRPADPRTHLPEHLSLPSPSKTVHETRIQAIQLFSDIILKLLTKTPEDRYQSVAGLRSDLEHCMHLLKGTIPSPTLLKSSAYVVGQTDVYSQFHVSQKLYGRQPQVDELLEAFRRISQPVRTTSSASTTEYVAPHPELLLVCGYSGIGKTSVIDQVHKPLVQAKGMFGRGKFDLCKRNVSVLLQALGQLINQILTQEDLPVWQTKIKAALGDEGQVVIDVIPILAKVMGPQPPVVVLPPVETARRLNSRLVSLVQLFSTADHPLVLFVDDLQWADAMSLSLIQVLFDIPRAHLLMIGAYRDNEVDDGHPLMQLIANIREASSEGPGKRSRLNTITLQPLQLPDILALVKDTLRCDEEKAYSLARLLQLKARGNPFFINQILQSFHSDGLVTFDYAKGWVYDVDKLKFSQLSEDVVDLLCKQIDKMPPECSKLLQVASCVGNRFSLHELAVAADGTPQEIASLVWVIMQTGLILPVDQCYALYVMAHEKELGASSTRKLAATEVSDSSTPTVMGVFFRFSHDRCQQAAYRLIPESERASMRIRIGRSMLHHTTVEDLDLVVTDIVEHFNAGYALLEDPEEIKRIIDLNILAAQKAKLSTVYESAVKYASVSIDLLQLLRASTKTDYWTLAYEISTAVYVLYCECFYLHSRFDDADARITEGLAHVKHDSVLERAKLLHIRQFIYIAQSRYEEALAIGVDALAILGFNLPTQAEIDKFMQSEEQLMAVIKLSVAQPPMVESIPLKIMELLTTTFSPAYFLVHPLFNPIMIAMLQHSISHGKSAMLCFTLSGFTHVMHEYQYLSACYRVGKLAKKLVDEYGAEARAYRCKVHSSFSVAVAHWAYPMVDCMPEIRKASLMCLEEGDHEYFSYTSFFLLDLTLYTGRHPLEVVLSRQKDVLESFKRRKLPMAIKYVNMWHICLAKLLNQIGVNQEEYEIDGVVTTQAELLAEMQSLKINSFLFACDTAQLTFAYYSMQYPRAISAGERAINIPAWKRGGLVVGPQFTFYYSLALLANIPCSDSKSKDPLHPTSLEAVLLQSAMYTASSSTSPHTSAHKAALEIVAGLQESMLLWSQHAPMNYMHKYQLVEAERVRVYIFHHPEIQVCGPRYDLVHAALRMYDSAIFGAKLNQFMHEEALANELAARFLLAVNRRQDATTSYYSYASWGCHMKLQQLKNEFPIALHLDDKDPHASHYLPHVPPDSPTTMSSPSTSTASTNASNVTFGPLDDSAAITSPKEPVEEEQLALPDLKAVLKACLTFSVETDLQKLVQHLLWIVIQHAGASRGTLVLRNEQFGTWNDALSVSTDSSTRGLNTFAKDSPLNSPQTSIDHDIDENESPLVVGGDLSTILPLTMLNYVSSTKELCVVNNLETGMFSSDEYFKRCSPKAALMFPVLHQSKYIGILYVENQHAGAVFTMSQVKVLRMLIMQAALSIENARLYQHITDWTTQLQHKNQELEVEVKERHQAETSMRAAKELAEKANAAKTAFVANLSHEIRTPMNAVIGLSRILMDTELTAEQLHYLNLINDSGKLLVSIINDVLDFSRIEEGGLELEDNPFSLVDSLESSIHMCYDLAKDRKLDLLYTFDRSCPSVVFGDSSRLQQILLNLLANGTKFTHQGHIRVSVTARRILKDGKRVVENRLGAGMCEWVEVQVSIRDTGIGISDKMLPRLFKPFNQGDSSVARKYGGTGLGLAISRRLAEAMRGRLWVESELGKGSTFAFTIQACSPLDTSGLPLSPSLHTSQTLTSQANLHGLTVEEAQALRGLRVLLVCESEIGVVGWKYLFKSYEMEVVRLYHSIQEANFTAKDCPYAEIIIFDIEYGHLREGQHLAVVQRILDSAPPAPSTHSTSPYIPLVLLVGCRRSLTQSGNHHQPLKRSATLGSMPTDADSMPTVSELLKVKLTQSTQFPTNFGSPVSPPPSFDDTRLTLSPLSPELVPHAFCKFEVIKPFKQQLVLQSFAQHVTNRHNHIVRFTCAPVPLVDKLKSMDIGNGTPFLSHNTTSPLLSHNTPYLDAASLKSSPPEPSNPPPLQLSPATLAPASTPKWSLPSLAASVSIPPPTPVAQLHTRRSSLSTSSLAMSSLLSPFALSPPLGNGSPSPTDSPANPLATKRRLSVSPIDVTSTPPRRSIPQDQPPESSIPSVPLSSLSRHSLSQDPHTSRRLSVPLAELIPNTNRRTSITMQDFITKATRRPSIDLPQDFSPSLPLSSLPTLPDDPTPPATPTALSIPTAAASTSTHPSTPATDPSTPSRGPTTPSSASTTPSSGPTTPTYPNMVAKPSGKARILPIATECPLRILVAEDNPTNAKVIRAFLSRLGYNNVPVLMDIGMEPMDGLECTRKLREWESTRTDQFTPLVIIAQTANAHAESKGVCISVGMTDYLHKPINLDELVRTLRQSYDLTSGKSSSYGVLR